MVLELLAEPSRSEELLPRASPGRSATTTGAVQPCSAGLVAVTLLITVKLVSQREPDWISTISVRVVCQCKDTALHHGYIVQRHELSNFAKWIPCAQQQCEEEQREALPTMAMVSYLVDLILIA